ncbi:hypothetical protein BDB00DRAFT_928435 [Zychaea mexicana]|uniref:uncharacterized protein n=1 Tax=Zychaea mexicana TaxID=64656 RepID=UPI0022FF295D|nr:uncharacterized protein BDB00DRAFT_928435 [Zychaea mexicana]KAI9494150.1 hypothetical protein BDB00DRAFT_928435 [Zychaea mexicana]
MALVGSSIFAVKVTKAQLARGDPVGLNSILDDWSRAPSRYFPPHQDLSVSLSPKDQWDSSSEAPTALVFDAPTLAREKVNVPRTADSRPSLRCTICAPGRYSKKKCQCVLPETDIFFSRFFVRHRAEYPRHIQKFITDSPEIFIKAGYLAIASGRD